MPINIPDYETIINRIRADVSKLLPDLDPTIFSSLIRAITDSNAGRHYDMSLLLKQLETEIFPSSDSSREAIERAAAWEGITPFSEQKATGSAIFTGTVGANITEGELSENVLSNKYAFDQNAIISNISATVTLTRSGTTVTATAAADLDLATNIEVTIAGANQSEYNGDFQITMLSSTTFSYEIVGTPATPATGTITAACDCAIIPIISSDYGIVQNLDSGAKLTLTQEITNIDEDGYVTFPGLTGGQDVESSTNLLIRVLQSRANPVSNFNESAIELQARSVQGVTRVLVNRVTPAIGDVTILFMRDNDDDPIPSAAEVQEVKDKIVEILQATSEETDVFVLAPTAVPTTYNFSFINPDTPTMRAAVENSLIAFYQDEVTFETTVQEEKYNSAIINTIDPDTGDTLESFDLFAPVSDITVTTNEIGTLDEVIFP